MKFDSVYINSPVGVIELRATNTHLTEINFVEDISITSGKPISSNKILAETAKQMQEYFAGERTHFDIPLEQHGTPFQERVWEKLMDIPFGETISYKKLAEWVGSDKASRAVGSANGRNHLPIIVPCHRVINADGGLGGYASGLEVKKKLLDIEQKGKK